MLKLSIGEAVRVMKGEVVSSRTEGLDDFPPISIDTRTLDRGEAYFAIRGKRFDGHRFAGEAVRRGAAVLVVSRPVDDLPADSPPHCIVRVKDTLTALQDLACHLRTVWNGPLVAISGSMGKTTTRRFITQVLGRKLKVLEPNRNFNNEIGVPLTLARLEEDHQIAVLELGMNRAGEIARLSRLSHPNIALLTNVAPVHQEFFPSLEAIAEAKGEILEGLSANGPFIFNGDDTLLREIADRHPGRKISFALDRPADYRFPDFTLHDLHSAQARLVGPGFEWSLRLGFGGIHFLYNILATVAVSHQFLPESVLRKEWIEALEPVEGRGILLDIGGVQVWDDSYNSNPRSVETVLRTFQAAQARGRKIVALGDMLELGKWAEQYHEALGKPILQCCPDLLVTVGTRLSQTIARAAVQLGFPEKQTVHFETSEEAGHCLSEKLREGDLLLVKGSRGIEMEKIISCLRESKGTGS